MMKHTIQKALAFVFALCLIVGMATVGVAEDVSVTSFDAMGPVLDLVASAAICASDFPTVISDEETDLDSTFITFFFTNGLQADASLNITQEMLSDVSQQEACLSGIFAAQIPALDVITPPETTDDYIGFLPVYVEAADDGAYYLIGEIYRGSTAIGNMATADYNTLSWEDRAIFTLKADATATYGYRIEGFSVGSELLMEQELQDYTNTILVEYINGKLGFSVLYPSLFDEQYFTEDENGAGAALPDGSASFTVKRADNTSGINLSDYATLMAESQNDSHMTVYDDYQYATVSYNTDDGSTVFSIYIVTEKYIYTAQLSYPTDQTILYGMYTMYLENSFVADEVSVG